ncbi:MAG TPA: hypothetical protein VFZ99_05045 [Terriglobales bacterium]
MNERLNRVHLVTKDDQAEACKQSSNIHLSLGDYFADVVCDDRSFPEIWHWIVQKNGSPAVIHWAHENNREIAEREALAYLQSLLRKEQLRNYRGK